MVFTPMNESQTERLSFEDSEVKVISGDRHKRGYGLHAIVEIAGVRYEVHGADCGSPGCVCDAFLAPVRKSKGTKIKLTTWEIAQTETALRERAARLVELGADEDAVNQTRSLQERFAAAQSVTILDPRK